MYLLTVQGTLKSLLQNHSLKASVQCSTFFMVQISHSYMTNGKTINSVQLLSRVQLFATPWTAACQASLSFTISHSLLKFISTESVTLSNHLILYCPFLFFPSIFLSIKVFSNESGLHIRWAKFWNFSFSPSSEFSGLISFRIDWFDFLAIQGTLKSLLQHHNSKASFFHAQPSLWSNSHIQT